jgi:hypothetical protein
MKEARATHLLFPSHKSNGQLASPDEQIKENCANGDGWRAYRRCPAYHARDATMHTIYYSAGGYYQRNLAKFISDSR